MRGLIIAVVLIALVGCTETAQTPSVSFEEMENFIQQAYQLRTNAVTNPGTLSLLSQLYASSSSKLQEYEQRRAEFWRNWGNLHGQVLSFTSTVSLIPGTLKQIGLTTSVEAYEILTITWKPDTTAGMKICQEKLAQAKTDEERKQAEQAIENIKAFPQIVNTGIGVTHSLELAWTGQGFQIIKDGYSEVSQGGEFPASPDYLLTSPTPTPTPTGGGVTVGVWEQLIFFGSAVGSLAIDPGNPQTLYAGTAYGGVWKSSDGGANWAASSSGLPSSFGYSLAIDPSNPQILYAAGWSGVYKSSNGGASWAASSSGLPNNTVYSLVIDPSNSQTLYAGTLGGVWKSSDGGSSWAASSSGLTNSGVYCLALDPGNPQTLYAGTYSGGVWKSTNGGAGWAASSNGLTNAGVVCLALDPGNPQTLYAGTYGDGVWKSSNGGASWAASSGGMTNAGMVCLALDPSNSQTLYAGTSGGMDFLGTWDGGVWKSTNGGVSWAASSTGFPNSGVLCLALALDPSGTLYAVTANGVFRLAP